MVDIEKIKKSSVERLDVFKGVKITKSDDKFLRENDIDFSKFVRLAIKELRDHAEA